jgi:hypothetical protein
MSDFKNTANRGYKTHGQPFLDCGLVFSALAERAEKGGSARDLDAFDELFSPHRSTGQARFVLAPISKVFVLVPAI